MSFHKLSKPTKMSAFMPVTTSSDGNRSSPSKMFLEKGVVKVCTTFTGEHPC